MKPNPLVGKKITAVYLANDKKAIKFDVEGAAPIIANAEGACCSSTWIEYVESPENLIGIVQAVENVNMPDRGSPGEYEVITYYGCKILTNKGSCLLDYRNESNGYYGGGLSWPGEYFFGGVYGQNLSIVLKDETAWEKIA